MPQGASHGQGREDDGDELMTLSPGERQRRWRAKPENKAKAAARQRERYASMSPEQKATEFEYRWRLSLRRFGMTPDDYMRMLDRQNGVCGICGRTNGQKKLCVDHCHATGRVRGLLCTKCNKGLGIFDDDVTRIVRAAEYLKE